jgi:hypothetical protein
MTLKNITLEGSYHGETLDQLRDKLMEIDSGGASFVETDDPAAILQKIGRQPASGSSPQGQTTPNGAAAAIALVTLGGKNTVGNDTKDDKEKTVNNGEAEAQQPYPVSNGTAANTHQKNVADVDTQKNSSSSLRTSTTTEGDDIVGNAPVCASKKEVTAKINKEHSGCEQENDEDSFGEYVWDVQEEII